MADGSTYIAPAALAESPVALEPWRDVLLRAAQNIESKGWWQKGRHGTRDPNSVCVILAMPPGFIEACKIFAKYVGVQTARDLPNWNDTPGRTAAEVTAALRACANQ